MQNFSIFIAVKCATENLSHGLIATNMRKSVLDKKRLDQSNFKLQEMEASLVIKEDANTQILHITQAIILLKVLRIIRKCIDRIAAYLQVQPIPKIQL